MKKILIPTDFTETAENALGYALELALVTKAECTLLHVAEMPDDFTAQMENRVVAVRKNAKEKLGRNAHQLKTDSRYSSLTLLEMVETGDPDEVITRVAKEKGMDLVVIGLSKHSGFESFFAGNTGAEVVEDSEVPVLAVPLGVAFKAPREIIYAAEYREEDLQNLEEISQLAKLFDARLRVIHIEEENSKEEKLRFRGFSKEVEERLSYPYVTQELHVADDVEEGLLDATAGSEGVILSMAHYHKSFLKEAFGRSHTKNIAMETKVPLLVYYEKEA